MLRQQILAQKMFHKTSQQNDKAIAICQLILSKRASYVERSPLLHKRKKNLSDSLRRRCTQNGKTERKKGETEKESKFPKSLHDTSSFNLRFAAATRSYAHPVCRRLNANVQFYYEPMAKISYMLAANYEMSMGNKEVRVK